MASEDTPDVHRTDPTAGPVDGLGDRAATPNYDDWSDERLVDGYRRNSILLREYGTDGRTIRALCAIEERLRARGIDPDGIVTELDD